jgi:hypothetical protein
VPAQSLTMMNSPFVIEQSRKWSQRLVADAGESRRDQVEEVFLRALGRAPTAEEREKAESFLTTLAEEHGVAREDIQTNARVWQDFAQAVFNFKEFIYIR